MLQGSHPFLSHSHPGPELQSWLWPQEHELALRHLLGGTGPEGSGDAVVVAGVEAVVAIVATVGVFTKKEPTVEREVEGSSGGSCSCPYCRQAAIGCAPTEGMGNDVAVGIGGFSCAWKGCNAICGGWVAGTN